MMQDADFQEYISPLTQAQQESIGAIRSLMAQAETDFSEEIETGKWWNGLLVYKASGVSVFALGPASGGTTTFHMMPYYCSAELQALHGQTFKPIQTGKSCIRVKSAQQIPVEAIRDVIAATPHCVEMNRQKSR